jgi:hypothetical protein
MVNYHIISFLKIFPAKFGKADLLTSIYLLAFQCTFKDHSMLAYFIFQVFTTIFSFGKIELIVF